MDSDLLREKIIQPILATELKRRWNAVRDVMKVKGIYFLLIQNNNEYLGGYVTWFTDLPTVEAEDTEVDNCAMHIVMKPERFDVIFAENADGDILSDVGAGVIGGLGFVPGGNIGDSMAVFELIHGTDREYADKNIANPIASILAAKMMINYSGENVMVSQMEEAVREVLLEGKVQTFDLWGTSSTTEVAETIAEKIRKRHRKK